MLLEPYQMNTIVKQLNDSTERALTAEEEAELASLRAKTAEGRPADNATMRALQALRAKPIDVARRVQLVEEMRANPMYEGYRVRLLNHRIVIEQVL